MARRVLNGPTSPALRGAPGGPQHFEVPLPPEKEEKPSGASIMQKDSFYCSKPHTCRFDWRYDGLIKMLNGTLSTRLGSLCIGSDRVIFPVADERERVEASCLLNSNYTGNTKLAVDPRRLPRYFRSARQERIVFWQNDVGAYTWMNQGWTIQGWPSPSQLSFAGTSLLLDPCVGDWQFGHTMTALIKLVLLLEGGSHVHHIVKVQGSGISRWDSRVVNKLLLLVSHSYGRIMHRSAGQPYLLEGNSLKPEPKAQCFQNVVSTSCSERYYRSQVDAAVFQSFIRRHFRWFTPTITSCPPASAAVLHREGEGAGLRRILNFDTLERALQANGISSYRNVSVWQGTPFEDAVRLFSSFGLLISTHSSALKLLAFSHPSTIVIEVRPKQSANWYGHSVFSEGPDKLGIHYYAHSNHTSNGCDQKRYMCKEKGHIYSDIWLDGRALTEVIRTGLAAQRSRCSITSFK